MPDGEPLIHADVDIDARPTHGVPLWERAVIVALTALTALIVVVLVVWGLVALRQQDVSADSQAADQEQIAQLRGRLLAAEAVLDCRDDLAVAAMNAERRARRQSDELVIKTAEQFDRMIRGEAPDPDAVHAQVTIVRLAHDEADRATEAYAAALGNC